MDIRKEIEIALLQYINNLKNENRLPIDKEILFNVDIPKNRAHGDYATNLPFVLARELKIKPIEIAKSIQDNFDYALVKSVGKIEIADAGYLNFFLDVSYLKDLIYEIESKNTDFGKSDFGQGVKILIEFVSANPTGPLNVVNARAASVGAALANLFNCTGYQVYCEFYINDTGVQAQLFAESLRARYLELNGRTAIMPENGYLGDYVIALARELFESGYFLEKYTQPENIPLDDFKQIGLKSMIEKQRNNLNDFRVNFDNWFHESQLHQKNKPQNTLELLKKSGYTYESGNAIWFKSTDFGDEKDRVLLKSDGNPTYFLNDIAYHQDKFERGFERLIDLWGPDHHGHIIRMKSALIALGHRQEDIDIMIIQQVNLLRDGKRIKMSKRAGQIESISDLIDEVGVDAARFFFLLRGSDSHLDFDLELAKYQSNDNPVFYVQYAHARVCNIFHQAQQRNIPIKEAKFVDLSLLALPEEQEIIKILSSYPDIIIDAVKSMEPHRLVRYLMDLSNKLHQYYNRHRVITEDDQLTDARLILMKIIKIVVRNGLNILGVSAPERM